MGFQQEMCIYYIHTGLCEHGHACVHTYVSVSFWKSSPICTRPRMYEGSPQSRDVAKRHFPPTRAVKPGTCVCFVFCSWLQSGFWFWTRCPLIFNFAFHYTSEFCICWQYWCVIVLQIVDFQFASFLFRSWHFGVAANTFQTYHCLVALAFWVILRNLSPHNKVVEDEIHFSLRRRRYACVNVRANVCMVRDCVPWSLGLG